MTFISINLLPPEFTRRAIHEKRFLRIQFLGIAVLLSLVFLTSLLTSLRVLQHQNIAQAQTKLSDLEKQVLDLKGAEAKVTVLKNRLDTISRIKELPSKQLAVYGLIFSLLPQGAVLSSLTVDQNGVNLSLATADSSIIDSLIGTLSVSEKNRNLVDQVSIDNLTRSRDGIYRLTLIIKTK